MKHCQYKKVTLELLVYFGEVQQVLQTSSPVSQQAKQNVLLLEMYQKPCCPNKTKDIGDCSTELAANYAVEFLHFVKLVIGIVLVVLVLKNKMGKSGNSEKNNF
jgi:hypothetical protein